MCSRVAYRSPRRHRQGRGGDAMTRYSELSAFSGLDRRTAPWRPLGGKRKVPQLKPGTTCVIDLDAAQSKSSLSSFCGCGLTEEQWRTVLRVIAEKTLTILRTNPFVKCAICGRVGKIQKDDITVRIPGGIPGYSGNVWAVRKSLLLPVKNE